MNCGQMENFIKECKSAFDMDYVSSSSQIVNANRIQIHFVQLVSKIGVTH